MLLVDTAKALESRAMQAGKNKDYDGVCLIIINQKSRIMDEHSKTIQELLEKESLSPQKVVDSLFFLSPITLLLSAAWVTLRI